LYKILLTLHKVIDVQQQTQLKSSTLASQAVEAAHLSSAGVANRSGSSSGQGQKHSTNRSPAHAINNNQMNIGNGVLR